MILGYSIVFSKDIYIDSETNIIQNNEYNSTSINPGDRLILLGRTDGSRQHVQFKNVHGAFNNPVVITHPAGQVVNFISAKRMVYFE